MSILFEIEDLIERRGRAYLIARMVEPRSFSLCGQHTIGGYEIEPWIGQPSARDESGEPRVDLFSFRLRNPADLAGLEIGQRVELSRGSCETDRTYAIEPKNC